MGVVSVHDSRNDAGSAVAPLGSARTSHPSFDSTTDGYTRA